MDHKHRVLRLEEIDKITQHFKEQITQKSNQY